MTQDGVPPLGSGHSPKGGAASSTASPAKPSVPNAWQVGPIVTRHPQGATYVLPGWVRGPFGLDYRYSDYDSGAWILTHLPTGYAALAIQEPLETAQSIADEVANWGDWNFTNPEDTARFKGRLPQLRERYPDAICHVSEFPLREFMVAKASAIEARRAATVKQGAVHESAARQGDAQ